MEKRIVGTCFLLLILLAVSGTVFAQVKDKDYVQGITKDEILIGCFFVLTGPAAYQGLGLYQASELYFNEVNAKGGIHGRKIKLLLEDTAGTPIKGVAACNKLLSEKPFMLYGPALSGVALAVLETVVREGIPWFNCGVATPKIFTPMRKNVFRTSSVPDSIQAKAVVDYDVYSLKVRRIGIIHDATEYGKGGADLIVERLAEYGLEPIVKEAYNSGDIDFTPQILKMKQANPEVVHVYGYAKEAAILVRQAKELGLSTQFILATAIGSPAFLESAGDAAIGCLQFYAVPYLIDSPDPLIADFVKKMKETYRVPPGRPSFAELMGIGGAIVAVEGLRRAGRDLTWEKYINALESIKDFKTGFIMPTTFSATDHNGIKGGKLLAVLPGKKWSVLAEDLVVREKVEKIQ